jgi:hypothetical protein
MVEFEVPAAAIRDDEVIPARSVGTQYLEIGGQ